MDTVVGKRWSAFVGVEAEGPLQDVKTLFIPRSEQRPISTLVDLVRPEVVYYGAGNNRGITMQQVYELLAYRGSQCSLPFGVVVEMTLADIATSHAYVTLRANHIPFRCVLVDT